MSKKKKKKNGTTKRVRAYEHLNKRRYEREKRERDPERILTKKAGRQRKELNFSL